MDEKKLSVRELATQLGWSPEHIRKVISSEAFPSRSLRDQIAGKLEIDPTLLEKEMNADRWEAKYGKIPAERESTHPLDAVWDSLTAEQQDSLLCVARCMARRGTKRSA